MRGASPMTFSLNEIEAMGKRAARGAGLSWGLAEEAGKATRWLTARGLPGAELLADILSQNDKRDGADLTPATDRDLWEAPGGRLCPLIAGAALSDRAAEIAGGRMLNLMAVDRPLLLAPFAAGAARQTGVTIHLAWDGLVITLGPRGETIDGEREVLTARSTHAAFCRRCDDATEPAAPIDEPAAPVDAATWSRLAAFAQRTFAPATEASRLAGAGAGLSDNN